jgi:3-isopropylmalate dehydratase small subunit
VFTFRSPPVLRRMLMEGLEEVALTLRMSPEIERFRAADWSKRPWAIGRAAFKA